MYKEQNRETDLTYIGNCIALFEAVIKVLHFIELLDNLSYQFCEIY